MQDIIRDLQDMRYLKWSKARYSSGTAGTFLKSYETSKGRRIYYKLSDFDSMRGIVGHECVNELIVDRLLRELDIPHLSYRLINALIDIDGKEYETWLCASDDFKQYGESKLALEDYYQMEKKESETPLDFCKRMGWGTYIYEMLVTDYLILNRDRHGANIEVLRNSRTKTIRLAPLFDHGLSFVCRCQQESDLDSFDVMADLRIQSFIGGHSSEDNLKLIPPDICLNLGSFTEASRSNLFYGLDHVLSDRYFDTIWRMLWGRWQRLTRR